MMVGIKKTIDTMIVGIPKNNEINNSDTPLSVS